MANTGHTYVVLLNDPKHREAWGCFLQFLRRQAPARLGDPPASDRTSSGMDSVLCFDRYGDVNAADQMDGDFTSISECLNLVIAKRRKVLVMVDEVNLAELNPLLPCSWSGLLARLILAYPETRWAFSCVSGEGTDEFVRRFGIHTILKAQADPLFDPEGLRDEIRRIAHADSDTRSDAKHLPRRELSALALDEEAPYCYLHAYTAYRFGYRAAAVEHGRVADELLGSAGSFCPKLSFEDLYISFPDTKIEGMSDLTKRKTRWPQLTYAERRVFVTSDHDRSKWQRNQAFLERERARGGDIRKFHKPHAGMFRIWEAAGLMQGLRWSDGKVHGGCAPGFVWPPEEKSEDDEDRKDHSSPGFLMMIAEHMIGRAERMIPAVQSVSEAVKGAVLANDALELLGTRTPTLAIEALRLKHHFEVLAECQFSGVEYHFPLTARLKELQRDVRAISLWFGRKHRESAATNAEMAILTDLVRIFRSYGQFDEEQQCLRRIRHLHNSLWMSQRTGRWLMWPPLRYLELLLSSFSTFVLVVMAWLVAIGSALTIAFSPYTTKDEFVDEISFLCGLQGALISMFTSGKPEGFAAGCNFGNLAMQTPVFGLVASTAMIIGYLHLAVLVAHLYTTINRR